MFKTKPFARFQRHARINDATLRAALSDAEAGLVEAELGGGLIKQRVARAGSGKRGGYRTVIAYR
ncbi:MAG: type II toxin-antitoxin system RelE/ParE family toxin [Hyphomicrobiaceae bacterium]